MELIMEAKKIKNRSEFIIFILAILGVLVVVNYFGIRIFKRYDMTQGKEYSISPATKKILKKLDDIITIKVFFSKNLPPNITKTVMDVKDILSEYGAYAGKNLRISWEDPAESEQGKELARSLGIPEVQLQTYEKDKVQAIKAYLGIGILYADKKEAIPVVQNLQNLEYDLTMAIMKVSRSSVPKVAILKTDTFPSLPPQYRAQMPKNPESTEEKLAKVFEQLRTNYDVNTVDLSSGTPIDSGIKTLIIPGGENMTERKLFEIDQFFMKGGNLIVLADAVTVNLQYGAMASPTESKLLDLLEFYGVRVEKNLILDHSCSQVSVPQQVGPFTMNVAVPYPYFVRLGAENFKKDITAVSTLSDVVLPWVSSLTLLVDQQKDDSTATASTQDSVKAMVLAHSSAKSWPLTGRFDLNPQQQWAPPVNNLKQYNLAAYLNGHFKSYYSGKSIPSVNSDANDTLSQINLKEPANDAGRQIIPSNANGHLIVIGDADFVSGQNAGAPGNIAMLMNMVDWLSLDDNLISIRSRALTDRTIDSDLLKKESKAPNIIRLINVVGMPLLVAIIGLVIFINRREHLPVTVATNNKSENTSK